MFKSGPITVSIIRPRCARMGIIRTIRLLARRMVTGARRGLLAACSSAPDPGTTFTIATPAIGRSTAIAGDMDITVVAITRVLMDIAATVLATTAVLTATEE